MPAKHHYRRRIDDNYFYEEHFHLDYTEDELHIKFFQVHLNCCFNYKNHKHNFNLSGTFAASLI